MSEHDQILEVDQAGESWTWLVSTVAAVFLLVATGLLLHFYAPAPTNDLQDEVRQLSQQVQLLKQEQAMPVVVLNRYRNSICYVFGVYQVGFPNQPARLRARVSGTGFIVANGLMATNRHVSEPWYGDPEAEALIRSGAVAGLEKLVAFFPGSPTAFELTPTVLSAHRVLSLLHVGWRQSTLCLELVPPVAPADLPNPL